MGKFDFEQFVVAEDWYVEGYNVDEVNEKVNCLYSESEEVPLSKIFAVIDECYHPVSWIVDYLQDKAREEGRAGFRRSEGEKTIVNSLENLDRFIEPWQLWSWVNAVETKGLNCFEANIRLFEYCTGRKDWGE